MDKPKMGLELDLERLQELVDMTPLGGDTSLIGLDGHLREARSIRKKARKTVTHGQPRQAEAKTKILDICERLIPSLHSYIAARHGSVPFDDDDAVEDLLDAYKAAKGIDVKKTGPAKLLRDLEDIDRLMVSLAPSANPRFTDVNDKIANWVAITRMALSKW